MKTVKMNAKVWILSSKKIKGFHNRGHVVGLEKSYDGSAGFHNNDYVKEFKLIKAKVVFFDLSTNLLMTDWFWLDELSKNKPI